MIRPHFFANSRSCVTSTNVVPFSRLSPKISSTIAAAVSPSRFPVGSSQNRIFGRFMNARANATRCCSPPDSCTG